MRRRWTRAVMALMAVTGAAHGQQPALSGVWKAEGGAFRNLEGSGAIVDPADGKLPYRAQARAQAANNQAAAAKQDPEGRCFQPGVPRATILPYPLQIVQNQRAVYIAYERVHAFRILYLDNATHNDGLGFAMGDSRAHWEGETLVADVLSFSAGTWFDAAGHHHSDQLHVTERYRLAAPDRLEYEARVEDPAVFERPWTMRVMLKRQAGVELVEDECELGTDGRRRHVSPFPGAKKR
jgi:hypothetical protein